jgi:hypothetical protein
MENTELLNKCPRENDLLKCIEYFESGGRGHNIYFTSKYRGQQRIFPIVISKAWRQPPSVLAA